MFGIKRWRPRHLLLSWVAYWTGLVAATIGPAVPALLRATSQTGNQGSIGFNFGSDGFALTVSVAGATIWHGAAQLTTIALWLSMPPLLIWLAWVYTRPKSPPAIDAPHSPLLGASTLDPSAGRDRTHDKQTERQR